MSRALLSLLCGLAVTLGAFADLPLPTANDPNEGVQLTRNVSATGEICCTLWWWGRSGWTYFVQLSEDLITWHYLGGAIATGEDAPIGSLSFNPSGTDRFFVRLKRVQIVSADPFNADFDGDKVANETEIDLGTDPLHAADTDHDGMSDDWETRYGLNPNVNDASADTDGDGISNLAEYQTGAFGTDPTDYYNGAFPAIEYVSGGGEVGDPGTFATQPLVLRLTRLGAPVVNSPITLSIATPGDGQISLTNDGTGLAAVLPLWTGSDGRVSVYFKHPAALPDAPLQGRTISARVGSAAATGTSVLGFYEETTNYDYTYPAGTVGRNATDAIDTRIAGKTAATALPVFSMQIHNPTPPAQPTYVRNTLSWCYDLRQQMTCISPWNSNPPNPGGVTGAGTAITAQHIILSAHYELPLRFKVRFITANNVVVDRTLRGKATHPAYQGYPVYYPDLTVYTLDSPLPATITPCKMLPANFANYLSYLGPGRPPVMALDQEEKALVYELYSLGNLAEYALSLLHPKRLEFFEALADGDSGDPEFLIINDTLVLLSTITGHLPFYPAGRGTFVTPQISALNAMIVAADADTVNTLDLGPQINTGLHVQTIDLSGFSTFTPP